MKKNMFLVLAALFLLAGCGISDETSEAIALQSLGTGGRILYSEHLGCLPANHIFVGKTGEGDLTYIRIIGEKIQKRERLVITP